MPRPRDELLYPHPVRGDVVARLMSPGDELFTHTTCPPSLTASTPYVPGTRTTAGRLPWGLVAVHQSSLSLPVRRRVVPVRRAVLGSTPCPDRKTYYCGQDHEEASAICEPCPPGLSLDCPPGISTGPPTGGVRRSLPPFLSRRPSRFSPPVVHRGGRRPVLIFTAPPLALVRR